MVNGYFVYDLKFSSNSYRCKKSHFSKGQKEPTVSRALVADDVFVLDEADTGIPALTDSKKQLDNKKDLASRTKFVFDPRLVGMAPIPLLNTGIKDYKKLFDFPSKSVSVVDAGTANNIKEVKYELTENRQIRIGFDASKDYGVVYHEVVRRFIDSKGAEKQAKIRVDVEYNDKIDGHFYPQSLKYVSINNGVVNIEEIVEVQSCELDRPIQMSEFQLAGLGMQEGRKVIGPGRTAMIWDGKTLKKNGDFQKDGATKVTGLAPGSSVWHLLMTLNIVVFGSIMAYCIYRMIRRDSA